eukprot:1071036_1
MAHFMQPALLQMFAPRQPLKYEPPMTKRKLPAYSGMSAFLQSMPKSREELKELQVHEMKDQRISRRKRQREEKSEKRISRLKKKCILLGKPNDDTNIASDAYKTLFVARLSYNVTEDDMREEFEYYGDVKSVRLVKKPDGTPRGYAFVEFRSGSDLKAAFQRADGHKLRGRRIVVDVERGRTVKNWVPRKLGGGLGGSRRGGKEVNTRYSGREDASKEDDGKDRDRDRRDRDGGRDRDRRDRSRGRDRDRDRTRDRDRGDRRREGRSSRSERRR